MRYFFLAIMILFFLPTNAKAEVLFKCGASKGYDYLWSDLAPEKGLIEAESAILHGSFSLVKNGEDYDIIYTDATERTSSAKAQGATVVPVQSGTDFLMVVVIYPQQTVEVYHFFKFLDEWHSIYSVHRNSVVSRGSVMRVECD